MDKIDSLIKNCIRGDAKAQDALYKQYRSRWYMLSMRYARNKDEANDLFQEGLIQIFKDLKQFNSKKSQFSTWSSRVLVHAILKFLKRTNWQHSFKDIETVIPNNIETNEKIHEILGAKELMLMIETLPLGYKLVFNMYAIEGFSHKEIAKKLDISIGTSKSQLFKARKVLQKKLEQNLTKS